jgi:hypothetical protein
LDLPIDSAGIISDVAASFLSSDRLKSQHQYVKGSDSIKGEKFIKRITRLLKQRGDPLAKYGNDPMFKMRAQWRTAVASVLV